MNMADDRIEETFMVQGADPPVPVGVAGERAGPAQQSANDCSVPLVGNQARGDYRVTGSDIGDGEAFVRIPKIPRTPPSHRRARVSSLPDGMNLESHAKRDGSGKGHKALGASSAELYSAPTSPTQRKDAWDIAWAAAEERSSKRRRDDPGPITAEEHNAENGGTAIRVRTLIEDLEKEIRKVVEVAKERNTKREVKEAATAMKRLKSDEAHSLLATAGERIEKRGENMAERHLAEWGQRIEKVEEELKSLKETNDRLRVENTELRRENEALKKGNQRLNERVKTMEATPRESARNIEQNMFGGTPTNNMR